METKPLAKVLIVDDDEKVREALVTEGAQRSTSASAQVKKEASNLSEESQSLEAEVGSFLHEVAKVI